MVQLAILVKDVPLIFGKDMFRSYQVQCSIHVKRIHFVNLVQIIYSPLGF